MPLSETAGAMECERIAAIVPPAGSICFRGDKFPIQKGAGWHGFSALQVGRLHGVMNLGRNMDWLHAVAGLFVGLMVGMTGVGGGRSEERGVGKEGVSTCRTRVSPSHSKKKRK